MKTSSAKIIKAVGNKYVSLHNGGGYWYFVYDNVEAGLFETESVYTMYLNSMDVAKWVEIGKAFAAKVEAAQ